VAGALKAVGTLVGIIFKARGKPKVELYWNIAWLAMLSVAILVAVRWGTVGVAAAISALCVPGVLFTEWLACRLIELPLGRLLGRLALPAAGAALASAAGVLSRERLVTLLPPGLVADALRLAALTLIMLAVYVLSLRALHPPIAGEARTFLGYFRKEERSPAEQGTAKEEE
jgi:hypothetical protein